MSDIDKKQWDEYRERELQGALPILKKLGINLDVEQPHVTGERYLMSGSKLVLTGKKDGMRVIVKLSSAPEGINEIKKERQARNIIKNLNFAYHTFVAPKELIFLFEDGYCISVVAFIEQNKTFLERPLREQFMLALNAFKLQEGVHATTYAHSKTIRDTFGMWSAREYLESFGQFARCAPVPEITSAQEFLTKNQDVIEQYCGFLTHADFVPHNLRIAGQDIYLLDYASIRFGNKYENWARFLNFMLLYNRPLEQALIQYVQYNRTPEEYLSLRCLRIYKVGFLLCFYTQSLSKVQGNLHALTQKRISFWTNVLRSLLNDTPLSDEEIALYQKERDLLRDEEEKKRQKKLH